MTDEHAAQPGAEELDTHGSQKTLRGARIRPGSEANRAEPEADADAIWNERLKNKEIQFVDLVRLKNWQTVEDTELKRQGDKFYDRALDAFRTMHRGSGPVTDGYDVNAAIFSAAACGIFLKPEGKVWSTILEREIGFDWSEGQRCLNRAETLGRRVLELWSIDATVLRQARDHHAGRVGAAESSETSGQEGICAWPAKRRNASRAARARKTLETRRPYCEVAYTLGSQVLSTVNLEKIDRLAQQSRLQAGEQLPINASASFRKRIERIQPQVELAELEFLQAAQRRARVLYALGMLVGSFFLGLICVGLAIAFRSHDVPAWYGIALLAGGIGAIVSVLQRMAKGTLLLEYDVGTRMLIALGGVRPLIGAIFGMVLFAVFDGGWLPSISVSATKPLAFYGVLGFLAGFSERFAQDMLAASAATLGSVPDEAEQIHLTAARAHAALADPSDGRTSRGT